MLVEYVPYCTFCWFPTNDTNSQLLSNIFERILKIDLIIRVGFLNSGNSYHNTQNNVIWLPEIWKHLLQRFMTVALLGDVRFTIIIVRTYHRGTNAASSMPKES